MITDPSPDVHSLSASHKRRDCVLQHTSPAEPPRHSSTVTHKAFVSSVLHNPLSKGEATSLFTSGIPGYEESDALRWMQSGPDESRSEQFKGCVCVCVRIRREEQIGRNYSGISVER